MLARGMYSNAFLGVISANMFFWMSVNFFLPVLPLYYHSLGMDDHQVGIAVGIFSLGAVLFRLYTGRAVDRCGSKPVISAGIALSAIAMIGYHYCQGLFSTALMRFIHGAGISGYSAATLTMVTLMNEDRNITKAVAVYTLFTMLGMGFSMGSANWLFSVGQMPLIVACGITAAFLSLILFPKKPKLVVQPQPKQSVPLREVAFRRGVLIPTVTLMAVNICFSSIMTFLPLLMVNSGIKHFSLFYIAYAGAVVFTRLWVGRLCEWLTAEKISYYILLLLAATMFVVGRVSAEWVPLLCGASIGVGYGLAFPVMATIVTASTEPANRGTAFGFFTMAVDFGFGAGAVAMGAVAHFLGYQAVFIVTGAYTLGYAALYRCVLMGKVSA